MNKHGQKQPDYDGKISFLSFCFWMFLLSMSGFFD